MGWGPPLWDMGAATVEYRGRHFGIWGPPFWAGMGAPLWDMGPIGSYCAMGVLLWDRGLIVGWEWRLVMGWRPPYYGMAAGLFWDGGLHYGIWAL